MSDFLPLPDRAILSVTGQEARDFLNGLFTNDMGEVTPDRMGFGALLTPQGKILFDFFLVATDGGYLIDVAADQAAALFKRLRLYKLRAQVDLAERTDLGVGASLERAQSNPGAAAGNGVFVDPRLPALGHRRYGPLANEEQTPGGDGAAAYARHLITHGVPMLGLGFRPEEAFLLDVNYDVLGAVNYKKGCFVGQEVTSRMKRKGQARRRMARVTAQDDTPYAPGTDLRSGEMTIGTLGAWAGAQGLALVRVDRLAGADLITLEGETVQVALPAYLEA